MMASSVTTLPRHLSMSLCREERECSLEEGTRKGDTSLETKVRREVVRMEDMVR